MIIEILLGLGLVWGGIMLSRNGRNYLVDMGSEISKVSGYGSPIYELKMGTSTYTEFYDSSHPVIHICVVKNNIQYAEETIKIAFIHELAHVICPDSGHTHLFDTIEENLLQTAMIYGYIRNKYISDDDYPCQL